ncbi:MAG: cell division protein FtsQ/DivIB [Hyphomicrobiales bacterium]
MRRKHADADMLSTKPMPGLFSRVERLFLRQSVGVCFNVGALTFLGATMFHALVLGGHFQVPGSPLKSLADNTARYVGFSANEITIGGLKEAKPAQVLDTIGVTQGGSLIGFDVAAARDKLRGLDWVAKASVLRLFPNRLHVEVIERQPYALWQTAGSFYVIDESGKAMTHLDAANWAHLPVVVGRGAQENAATLVNQLSVHSSLRLMVRAAARVADRHWTLYLANGVRVLLPEDNVPTALETLMKLEREQSIMSREIVSVDLRLADRVTLRLSERGAAAREENAVKVSRK